MVILLNRLAFFNQNQQNSISTRQKQGFSSPDASWFKGESIDFVKTKLFNGYTPLYDYLDKHSVSKLVNQHLDGEVNRRLLIWSLLNVNIYLEGHL